MPAKLNPAPTPRVPQRQVPLLCPAPAGLSCPPDPLRRGALMRAMLARRVLRLHQTLPPIRCRQASVRRQLDSRDQARRLPSHSPARRRWHSCAPPRVRNLICCACLILRRLLIVPDLGQALRPRRCNTSSGPFLRVRDGVSARWVAPAIKESTDTAGSEWGASNSGSGEPFQFAARLRVNW
jgi:hypothetical protein